MSVSKKITITPIGGLGEFGKNMMLLEVGDEMIIIDCGIKLLKAHYGVNAEIPDMRFLVNNRKKIKGLLVTHGHLDHIGGIPFLLGHIEELPIYSSFFTASIIRSVTKDYGILNPHLVEIRPGEKLQLGRFEIEAIVVNHSIVESYAYSIATEVGTIVHSGDFRGDKTPYDDVKTDFTRLEEIGKRGVLALFSDSTGAVKEGYNRSETQVYENLKKIFEQHKKQRIIAATFSTQINRIQQIFDLARKYRRKVFLSGRSILKNMKIAQKDYYKKNYDDLIVPLKKLSEHQEHRVLILSTGTQGEPNSSLQRLAEKKHPQIKLQEKDVIVFSSSVIPGNNLEVTALVDELVMNGNEVIMGDDGEIHASGHGYSEELALMIKKINPQFFFPVHGNFYHLMKHQKIAITCGVPEKNTFLAMNGQRIELNHRGFRLLEKLRIKKNFINDMGFASVDEALLRHRKNMASSGIISVGIFIQHAVAKVSVKTLGVVDKSDSEVLEKAMEKTTLKYIDEETSERNEKKLKKGLAKRLVKQAEKYGVLDTEFMLHLHIAK